MSEMKLMRATLYVIRPKFSAIDSLLLILFGVGIGHGAIGEIAWIAFVAVLIFCGEEVVLQELLDRKQ